MILAVLALQAALGSVSVTDGDTVHDNRRNRDYRLAGIDAPETARAKCLAERELGERAAARLAEILEAAEAVTAEPAWDPRGLRKWPVDGFGRRIAVVRADGVDVGAVLLAEGLALPYKGSGARPDWCALTPPG